MPELRLFEVRFARQNLGSGKYVAINDRPVSLRACIVGFHHPPVISPKMVSAGIYVRGFHVRCMQSPKFVRNGATVSHILDESRNMASSVPGEPHYPKLGAVRLFGKHAAPCPKSNAALTS